MLSQQSLDSRSDASGFEMASGGDAPLLSCGTLSGDAQRACERATLMALYNSAGGPNWRNNQGWNTTADYCTWYGISCTNAHLVAIITLNSNQLAGNIPSEIGNFSELRSLWLNTNNISGTVPSSLGQLRNLEILNISENPLTGSIPASIGNLNLLVGLYFFQTDLRGALPNTLTNLTSLRTFIFGRTPAIPNQICVATPAVRNFLTVVENINPNGDDVQPGPSIQEGLPDCANSFKRSR